MSATGYLLAFSGMIIQLFIFYLILTAVGDKKNPRQEEQHPTAAHH